MFGEERMNSDKVDVFTSRSYHQSIFLTVDVIEVDVLVLDVIELDVLGARHFIHVKNISKKSKYN
jgi:hypothetical protein